MSRKQKDLVLFNDESLSAFSSPASDPKRRFSLVRIPPPVVRLQPLASGGLSELYSSIRSKSKDTHHVFGEFTRADGNFSPVHDMPLLSRRYRFLSVLDSGQSSTLIKALDTFCDCLVAIKVLHTQYQVLGFQESGCVQRLNMADPHSYTPILRLITCFMFDSHYCMVFEMLVSTPLTKYFTSKPDSKKLSGISKVALRLLQGLGFLQQRSVIHADMKPENILLETDGDLSSAKIVDFGNAINCIHDEISLYFEDFDIQTLPYRAPEVMLGLEFGMEVDLWSVGCILAELYIGCPLFLGADKTSILKKMIEILGPLPRSLYQRGKFFWQYHQFTSYETTPSAVRHQKLMQFLNCYDHMFIDLLSNLLIYNPAERMTVQEAAKHPFFAKRCAYRYLLPDYDQGLYQEYAPVVLNPQSYSNRPAVDKNLARRSSLQILRTGTCQSIDTELSHAPSVAGNNVSGRQVASVAPYLVTKRGQLDQFNGSSIDNRKFHTKKPHGTSKRFNSSANSEPIAKSKDQSTESEPQQWAGRRVANRIVVRSDSTSQKQLQCNLLGRPAPINIISFHKDIASSPKKSRYQHDCLSTSPPRQHEALTGILDLSATRTTMTALTSPPLNAVSTNEQPLIDVNHNVTFTRTSVTDKPRSPLFLPSSGELATDTGNEQSNLSYRSDTTLSGKATPSSFIDTCQLCPASRKRKVCDCYPQTVQSAGEGASDELALNFEPAVNAVKPLQRCSLKKQVSINEQTGVSEIS